MTTAMTMGVDPAAPGKGGMVLVLMKSREGKPPFEIVNSWPRFWGSVPEWCLEPLEEGPD